MENKSQFTYNQRLMPADRFNEIYNGAAPSTVSRLFAVNGKSDSVSSDDFSNVIGKRILCKAQGLSGGDKRLCKKQILAACGRKPLLGKAKKDAWLKCAQAQSITSGAAIMGGGSDGAGDAGADTGEAVGEEEKVGINWRPIIMIGGAALLLAGGIALVVSGVKKARLEKLKVPQ